MKLEQYLEQTNPETLKRLKTLRKKIETDIAYRQDEIARLKLVAADRVKVWEKVSPHGLVSWQDSALVADTMILFTVSTVALAIIIPLSVSAVNGVGCKCLG